MDEQQVIEPEHATETELALETETSPEPETEPTTPPEPEAHARERAEGGSVALASIPPLLVLAALVGFGTWYQSERIVELEGRLAGLETAGQTTTAHQAGVREGLDQLGQQIATLTTTVESAASEAHVARSLAERMQATETRLGSIGKAVDATASNLDQLEKEVGPDALEATLDERDTRLQARWENLSKLFEQENEKRLDDLDRRIAPPRDLAQMWRDLMGPVVQLAGETSVGSGVLLRSEPHPAGGFRTYLLTAWHVVRDIQGSPSKRDMPVPTTIYGEDGTLRHEEATLLVYDADLDAALLELRTPDALPNGAALASPEHLDGMRIFDRVYAVGCPLGNDPIPTKGEIASRNHVVDAELYWMINAPTYIGNSGGGIFDADTHELLGIFSKIYTHGSLRPTIVPHMGLMTPLSAVYDWLDTQGYASVHEKTGPASARLASANR